MSRILIAYGTSYGQTARIVSRMADRMTAGGHQVTVWRADLLAAEPTLTGFDRCVVAGSVLFGKHQTYLRRFVREHASALNQISSAFVSVCGAAASGRDDGQAEARKYVERFLHDTGWRPEMTRSFAGGVAYTRYGLFTRWMMKLISRRTGGPTDTSRDWEFTDWAEVDRFAEQVAPPLVPAVSAG